MKGRIVGMATSEQVLGSYRRQQFRKKTDTAEAKQVRALAESRARLEAGKALAMVATGLSLPVSVVDCYRQLL